MKLRVLSVGLAVVAALMLGLPATTASAQDARGAPSAAVNGFARASAAFVPANLNPNIDLWPVYSLSETDGSFSHGISAGLWPGFLVDATFFQFGYQPFERAFYGVAESAHPISPLEDEAGTTDFANLCAAGEVSAVPLPFDFGDARAPEPLLTGCQSLYTQYKSRIPYAALSARTASTALRSDGSALGTRVVLGPVTIGNAYASSYTDAASGKRTDAGATTILSDVQIAGVIKIRQIISTVRAVADGSARGAQAERSLVIVDATYQGEPVTIDAEGVSRPGIGDLDAALRQQGIEVRLIEGKRERTRTNAQASSGALVVRFVRESNADAVGGSAARCAQIAGAQPAPVATVRQTVAPNPLATPKPPYDQLPQHVEINETLAPPIPCPLLLLERSVDTGFALGGATAAARYQPIPSFGGFVGDDGPNTGGGFGGGGTGSGGISAPGGSTGGGFLPGPLLPGFNAVPPVPRASITGVASIFGPSVAASVRVLYAGLAGMLIALIVGRRTFRWLVRP